MILVDTGAWFAAFIPEDPDWAAATAWLENNQRPLITTDYIIDETLTLMRARRQHPRAIRIGAQFFAGELAEVHRVTDEQFRRAWDVFRTFSDKDWSFPTAPARSSWRTWTSPRRSASTSISASSARLLSCPKKTESIPGEPFGGVYLWSVGPSSRPPRLVRSGGRTGIADRARFFARRRNRRRLA